MVSNFNGFSPKFTYLHEKGRQVRGEGHGPKIVSQPNSRSSEYYYQGKDTQGGHQEPIYIHVRTPLQPKSLS